MSPTELIDLYGAPGLMIAGLTVWGMMERKERISLQEKRDRMSEEQTKREIEGQVTMIRILDLLGALNNSKGGA